MCQGIRLNRGRDRSGAEQVSGVPTRPRLAGRGRDDNVPLIRLPERRREWPGEEMIEQPRHIGGGCFSVIYFTYKMPSIR
jgi:hypothetical protein